MTDFPYSVESIEIFTKQAMHHNMKQLTFQLSHQMRRIVIFAHTCSPGTITCVHRSNTVGWGQEACPRARIISAFRSSTEDSSHKMHLLGDWLEMLHWATNIPTLQLGRRGSLFHVGKALNSGHEFYSMSMKYNSAKKIWVQTQPGCPGIWRISGICLVGWCVDVKVL